MSDIKKTPLNAAHRGLGAKMVDFGGWTCQCNIRWHPRGARGRAHQGRLFDVSHMGELRVAGKDALKYLQY